MREHEVPTHVQAEDRVLLWFTFPQIVAITAVSALSYGAYSYAPGPSEMRMALAVVIGLAGIAMVVGKIGGRQLPLVAADLLRYRLGARFYAGSPAQLVRSEPPAPVESEPGPISLMARRAGRGPRRVRVMARRGLPQAAEKPQTARRSDAIPSARLVRQAPQGQWDESGQWKRTSDRRPKLEGEAPERPASGARQVPERPLGGVGPGAPGRRRSRDRRCQRARAGRGLDFT